MGSMDVLEIAANLARYFVPFLFALCFHEYAHGWVAKLRGDRTAEQSGRLSMNPLVHADPLGTFFLTIIAILYGGGFFFGWAKPVPVNSRNLKNQRWDMFWVALAGPASNVLLALAGTVLLGLTIAYLHDVVSYRSITALLQVFIQINLFLAVFNLIPVHPLDGGKVVEPFLPYEWNRWLDDNQGMLNLLLMVFIFTAGWVLAIPVNWISANLLYVSALIGHSLA